MDYSSTDNQAATTTDHEDVDIRELLSFRLTRLAQVSDQVGQRWLRQSYGITLLEWRIIGVVQALSPDARFAKIAESLNTDKGQLSRTISALVKRDLLGDASDPSDQRGRFIKLTDAGQELYAEVMPQAIARNEDMLRNLSMSEIGQLFHLLDKLQPFMDARARNNE